MGKGVVLIFDEVVTGFRASPGGAQSLYDVAPDLTTMAKIVAGASQAEQLEENRT
ncbi:MAG: hypothetical protein Ct9H300mP27_09760 [Chloroflexota bacterium]|nr:MAG: hypothetical protein Ct9H300mP27_09760 [Chloroflexota bacterium]